jgi:nucleotide-binding universal stress UspA family protein
LTHVTWRRGKVAHPDYPVYENILFYGENAMSPQVGNISALTSRVLLATDLTDLQHTLPVAIDYALKRRAELKLIHVLPEVNTSDTNPSLLVHGDRYGIQHYAETILEDAAKKAREAGVKCAWTMRTWQVADAIRQVVQEWNPDHVIIGSHGTQKAQQELLGSVAESIFREIEVPVLAIGPVVQQDGKCFSKGARVLFATALNRESRAVAESVLEFARIHQAELTMLHVLPEVAKAHPSASRVHSYAERMFHEILSGISAGGPRPACMIERGQVVETILRVAGQGHFDLILLGAVSGASFGREIVPGTAYGVISRAPCPVLVLKEVSRPGTPGLSVAS